MNSVSATRERLSKRAVDAATAGSAERFIWDCEIPGFGLRITPRGVKSFVYQYRMKGEKTSRRYTIGRYGAWTPDGARDRCKELVRAVEAGEHPRDAAIERAAARERAKKQAIEREFGSLADTWLSAYKVGRRASSESLAALAASKLKARFEGTPIDKITRTDLREFFNSMPAKNVATKRAVFAYARILWGWADEQELIDGNPFLSLKAPPQPASRDRVLSDLELALVWQVIAKQTYPFGPYHRLLALTGQRRSEVAGMRWEELDRDGAEWVIPPARAKNNQAHIVPLSIAAIEQIAAISPKKKWPARGLVFTVTGKSEISGMSRAKRAIDADLAKLAKKAGLAPVGPWRIHDLRRTVATGLQRLGTRYEVTEAVLNHVSGARGGVAGIYQRHDWKAEKRTALERWADHLVEIVAKNTVADEAAKGGSPP